MNKINTLLIFILVSSSFAMSELIATIQCPKTLDIEYSLNCTISIQNVGDKTLRDIKTRCYLPSGFTYNGRKTGKFSLKWLIPELKPQAVHNHKFSLNALHLGEFTITAKAQTTKSSYTTKRSVKIISPDIEVKTSASGRVLFMNKQVVFTTIIHNKGNGSAHNVVSEGTFPIQLEYISSEPQGAFIPSRGERLAKIKWRFAEIPPGEKIEIKAIARAIAGVPRTQYNVLTTFRDKELLTSAAVRVLGGGGHLHVSTYDTDDPLEVGKQTIYVITIRNEGTSPATDVTLKNIIPTQMKLIRAEGPADYVFDKNSKELNFQSIALLQPGDKLTYKVVCKAVKKGSAKNTVRVRYAQFNKPIIDEEGTSIYKRSTSHQP